MSIVKNVTYEDFKTEVIESPIPVLVDFYAGWCGPCRMLAPVLENMANEFSGRVKIVKINVDLEPEIAAHFGIQSIPTLLAFSNGSLLDTVIGIGSPGQLRQLLLRMAGIRSDCPVRAG